MSETTPVAAQQAVALAKLTDPVTEEVTEEVRTPVRRSVKVATPQVEGLLYLLT